MKKMAKVIGQELEWVQPSAWKTQYELRSGAEVVATLRFRSSFGTFATGESLDGGWTFKRIGFWQTRATIRGFESDIDLALFKNNSWSGGGSLEFPDGRKLLATTNGWQTKLEVKTEAGETLLRFNTRGLVHLAATVEIHPAAAEMPELPWLVMFGWYLVVMLYMDTAASVAAVS